MLNAWDIVNLYWCSISISAQISTIKLIVMQISIRMQVVVDIWVLVSMMDFMPGRGEHETDMFYNFYGKSGATSWRYVHDDVMSHINKNKYKMVEQKLCS